MPEEDLTFDWLVFGADKNPKPLEDLDRQLRRNSFFTQASFERHGRETRKVEAYVAGLLDVLFEKGLVDPAELGEKVKAKQAEEAEKASGDKTEAPEKMRDWPSIIIREDKSDLPPVEPVNCAERMHVCHAVCCQLRFPLSSDEIEAGKVKWDLGHPYVIRHSEEGFCVHNDRGTGHCNVYEDRPQVCQRYSCRNDDRIWKDFDNMVLNEEFLRERLRGDVFVFDPGHAMPDVPVAFIEKPTSNGTNGNGNGNGKKPAPAFAGES